MKQALQWIFGAIIVISFMILFSVFIKKMRGKHVSATTAAVTQQKFGGIVRLHDAKTGRFFCSAAVVSPTQAVTAAHCVSSAFFGIQIATWDKIELRPANGTSIGVFVERVFSDNRTDQALLTGNFENFEALELETHPEDVIASFKDGKLKACGYPYAGQMFCSDVDKADTLDFWFSTTGNLYPGMSGGPVIDMTTGKVVGINTAMSGNRCVLTPTVELFSNLERHEIRKQESPQ